MKRIIIGESERAGVPITAVEITESIPGRRPVTDIRLKEVKTSKDHYFVFEFFINPHWHEVPCLVK